MDKGANTNLVFGYYISLNSSMFSGNSWMILLSVLYIVPNRNHTIAR